MINNCLIWCYYCYRYCYLLYCCSALIYYEVSAKNVSPFPPKTDFSASINAAVCAFISSLAHLDAGLSSTDVLLSQCTILQVSYMFVCVQAFLKAMELNFDSFFSWTLVR